MSLVDRAHSLPGMLDNAFTKLDRDKDGKLNAEEFRSFYEILTPGIAADKDGHAAIAAQEVRDRMDANADGEVTRTEMQSTGVLMPADLTDESLDAMVQYLLTRSSASASAAARLLAEGAISDVQIES
jgi:Ca2+-binding EF-hand superfamily protein